MLSKLGINLIVLLLIIDGKCPMSFWRKKIFNFWLLWEENSVFISAAIDERDYNEWNN